jgi:nicotinamidase-related amidase
MLGPLFPELPLPPFFDPALAGQVWRVPYQQRAADAQAWAERYQIRPASEDRFRLGLVLIDVQNTFCLPDFELYVAGRSGSGAIDDNRRLAEFIYRNLGRLSEISATLDTHQAIQIFHAIYLVHAAGGHPGPLTQVSAQDIASGIWRFNPTIAASLGVTPAYGQQQLQYYADQLAAQGKYELTVWPYHAMLGGIGHALVASIEEAVFFHSIARSAQPDFILKGSNPLTESYSAIGPEVLQDVRGRAIDRKNERLFHKLEDVNALVITGQAQSHCVASTVADLLSEIQAHDPVLARRVYLLEDTTSPVVVPGVVDYTPQAEGFFREFAEAGMHLVRSTEPIDTWPGI